MAEWLYITYSFVDSHRLPFGYGKHGFQGNIYAKEKNTSIHPQWSAVPAKELPVHGNFAVFT
jgi:hypothetical protein